MKIEQIELNSPLETAPLEMETWSISENRFGVASFVSGRRYITTLGLYTCKAIFFYDRNVQTALLCHLSVAYKLDNLIEGLRENFEQSGAKFSRSVATVVFGIKQIETRENDNHEFWPTMDEITKEIVKYDPKRIKVTKVHEDDHRLKNVCVDLRTGRVSLVRYPAGGEYVEVTNQRINLPNFPLNRKW